MIRLKQLRENAGMLQKEISSELGIERSLYGKYENWRSEPPYDVLIRIADYFNVTLDYLLGRTDEKRTASAEAGAWVLTADEAEMLSLFRELNDMGRDNMLTMMRGAVLTGAYKKAPVSGQIQEGIG